MSPTPIKTLVLGASVNPARYSHVAATRLVRAGHPVVLVGNRGGEIAGVPIFDHSALVEGVDTVTLYLGPSRQPEYYTYIVDYVAPRRIIFNPGTENPELVKRAAAAGITCITGCTLVMLSTGEYDR